MHGLRFVNLCRKGGKARSFATDELERDLSWWLGKSVDANLILRTYSAILLLHGDIMPPPSGAKAKERNVWAELVDALPPVGHFHKAWSQLVERVDDGVEERWVLLPGFEERCITLYQDAQAKGLKLVAELIVFRRRYGIRECRCKGRCKVQQFMLAEGRAARTGRSRRLAARLMRELRNDPPSMHQSRCQCCTCRQAIPPIRFSAHQLLAKLLVPEGETAPRPPRRRPNRKRAPLRKAA